MVVDTPLRIFIMIALGITHSKSFVPSSPFREAAYFWYEYGYNVIPLHPGSKQTAVKWDGWLAELSLPTITSHWQQNPTHELGFITNEDVIVLDADSIESVAALMHLEKVHGIKPNLIVKTAKGEHHHFKRAKGILAKSSAHCTKLYPNRIDVKTGRAMVILPPSTGKSIALNNAKNANALTEVGQDFIDAVNRHNGRGEPQFKSQTNSIIPKQANSENSYLGLKALLEHIDADSGYDDWLRVLMGIFHYTRGSDDGFDIANAWSGNGTKYQGENEIRSKWNTFDLQHPRPVTIATIMYMVDGGPEIYHEAENPFEVITAVAVGGAQ